MRSSLFIVALLLAAVRVEAHHSAPVFYKVD
jgi:hypothetical protein